MPTLENGFNVARQAFQGSRTRIINVRFFFRHGGAIAIAVAIAIAIVAIVVARYVNGVVRMMRLILLVTGENTMKRKRIRGSNASLVAMVTDATVSRVSWSPAGRLGERRCRTSDV